MEPSVKHQKICQAKYFILATKQARNMACFFIVILIKLFTCYIRLVQREYETLQTSIEQHFILKIFLYFGVYLVLLIDM